MGRFLVRESWLMRSRLEEGKYLSLRIRLKVV
jgi:hypothetical protein